MTGIRSLLAGAALARQGPVRGPSLPLWIVALGPVMGAAVALSHCDVPPGHQGIGNQVASPDECYACHVGDYEGAHNPLHPGNMPTTCGDCHDSTAWRPAHFPDHPFPLVGAHARTTCSAAQCHGDPAVYQDLPDEARLCVSCHRADYDASPFPGHQDFPLECQNCHTQEAWTPAANAGDHDLFPLEGAHAFAQCVQCHGDPPVYGGQPHECVGCHRADYDSSPFPGHDQFATSCQDCHTVVAWVPAAFDHDAFPLDGAHAQASCASCHGNPARYDLPTTCVGCHRGDYDASPYPGHQNFSTNCTDCHTTSAWTPASGGTHPEGAFPISGGAHDGIDCGDCHNEGLSASYAENVDCIGCHEHDRASVDGDHNDVGRYQYDASDHDFCRECHADGRN